MSNFKLPKITCKKLLNFESLFASFGFNIIMKEQKFKKTRKGMITINKRERQKLLTRLKPAPWHTYCMLEAMCSEEVLCCGRTELAGQLDVTLPTLSKYLTIWESQGLVREIPGGFVITQMDGPINPEVMTKGEVTPRYYNAKKIIDFWCSTYEQHYHQPYRVTNWKMAMNQMKKLLRFTDLEIERTIVAAITFYERKWASGRFPRPTIAALTTFLFQQAMPYADLTSSRQTEEELTAVESEASLVDEYKAKGWL